MWMILPIVSLLLTVTMATGGGVQPNPIPKDPRTGKRYGPIQDVDEYSIKQRYCPIVNIRFFSDMTVVYDCKIADRSDINLLAAVGSPLPPDVRPVTGPFGRKGRPAIEFTPNSYVGRWAKDLLPVPFYTDFGLKVTVYLQSIKGGVLFSVLPADHSHTLIGLFVEQFGRDNQSIVVTYRNPDRPNRKGSSASASFVVPNFSRRWTVFSMTFKGDRVVLYFNGCQKIFSQRFEMVREPIYVDDQSPLFIGMAGWYIRKPLLFGALYDMTIYKDPMHAVPSCAREDMIRPQQRLLTEAERLARGTKQPANTQPPPTQPQTTPIPPTKIITTESPTESLITTMEVTIKRTTKLPTTQADTTKRETVVPTKTSSTTLSKETRTGAPIKPDVVTTLTTVTATGSTDMNIIDELDDIENPTSSTTETLTDLVEHKTTSETDPITTSPKSSTEEDVEKEASTAQLESDQTEAPTTTSVPITTEALIDEIDSTTTADSRTTQPSIQQVLTTMYPTTTDEFDLFTDDEQDLETSTPKPFVDRTTAEFEDLEITTPAVDDTTTEEIKRPSRTDTRTPSSTRKPSTIRAYTTPPPADSTLADLKKEFNNEMDKIQKSIDQVLGATDAPAVVATDTAKETSAATKITSAATEATVVATETTIVSTETSDDTTETTSVLTESSDVIAETTSSLTESSDVTAETSSVSMKTPDVTTETTSVLTDSSDVTTETSIVSTNIPDVTTETSSFSTESSGISATKEVNGEQLSTKTPLVTDRVDIEETTTQMQIEEQSTRTEEPITEVKLKAVNGNWSKWSYSDICVDGRRLKTRLCNEPSPIHGGLRCESEAWPHERLLREEATIRCVPVNTSAPFVVVEQAKDKVISGPKIPKLVEGEKNAAAQRYVNLTTMCTCRDGEKGARGQTGPEGSRGSVGRDGAPGVQGLQGLRGESGERGANGMNGLPGLRGIKGDPASMDDVIDVVNEKVKERLSEEMRSRKRPLSEDDVTFISRQVVKDELQTWLKGNKELLSKKQGLKGEPGVDGKNGKNGRDGLHGKPGAAGLKGDIGEQGPPGIAAAIPVKREKGDQGERGTNGRDGESGANGLPGPPGFKGDRGLSGPIGPQGKQGIKGASGQTIEGPLGAPGAPGLQGIPGRAGKPGKSVNKNHIRRLVKHYTKIDTTSDERAGGPRGPPGPPGIAGIPGKEGPRGLPADRGFPGPRGYAGLPGRKGESGDRGSIGFKGEPGGGRGRLDIGGVRGEKGEKGDCDKSAEAASGMHHKAAVIFTVGDLQSMFDMFETGSFAFVSSSNELFIRALDGWLQIPTGSTITKFPKTSRTGNTLDRQPLGNNWGNWRPTTSVTGAGRSTTRGVVIKPRVDQSREIVDNNWTDNWTLMKNRQEGPDIGGRKNIPKRHWPYRKLNETVYFPPRGLFLSRPYLMLVALNHPYSGEMGGVGRINYKCFKQASTSKNSLNGGPLNGGYFRAYISDRLQSLKHLVKDKYRHLPVANLKGEQLFRDWNSIFDTKRYAAFNPRIPIYTFSGVNVRNNSYWPVQKIWHGSHANGNTRLTGTQCNKWRSGSRFLKASSASISTLTPSLNEELTPCSQKLIVLCIRIADDTNRVS